MPDSVQPKTEKGTRMSMQRIRKSYGVPAKRGMRITFRGKPCTISGTTRGATYLTIRFDGSNTSHRIHPTWEVEYPTTAIPTSIREGTP